MLKALNGDRTSCFLLRCVDGIYGEIHQGCRREYGIELHACWAAHPAIVGSNTIIKWQLFLSENEHHTHDAANPLTSQGLGLGLGLGVGLGLGAPHP